MVLSEGGPLPGTVATGSSSSASHSGAGEGLPGDGGLRHPASFLQGFGWAGGQPVLGLPFGSGVRLRPRKELVQVEAKIGCDRGSGIADFLDNRIFHSGGLVRSSGVQITGMCRWW